MGFITFIIIPFLILGYCLQVLMTLTRLNMNEFKRLSDFLINLIPFPILLPLWIYDGIKMTIDNIKKLQKYNDAKKALEKQSLFDYQERIKGVGVNSKINFPPDFIDPEQFLREMQP